jgi:hypothetical protein
MKTNLSKNRIETTLGELIATISEVAFEDSADTQEGYNLTRLVLAKILKRKSRGSDNIDWRFSRTKYRH